VIVIGHMNLW